MLAPSAPFTWVNAPANASVSTVEPAGPVPDPVGRKLSSTFSAVAVPTAVMLGPSS
ncbi:hypothetical protein CfE428DRAFT_6705 [Chthoniobacter flavus Ellin428]|uniref:Uncharacterized protein n=1 Tax=Chthoniobacter flavus Ellin428 TaxID=497964 RepID=B4DCR4_9BACT|nr:hypothetical protein CfE428DRAFT_6705 [Chthoniobacter flavus Ellin428]